MQSSEGYGPLYLENLTFVNAIASSPPSSQEGLAELQEIMDELTEECPYVGQSVVVVTESPAVALNQNGEEFTVPAGNVYGLMDKFYFYMTGDEANIGLQLRLNQEGKESIVTIDCSTVKDIQLQDQRQPFSVEESKFNDLMRDVKKLGLEIDKLVLSDFITEYINTNICTSSRLIGAEVDLLICDPAEIDVFDETVLPWHVLAAIGKTTLECVEQFRRFHEADYDDVSDDEFVGDSFGTDRRFEVPVVGETVDGYRGRITAKVMDFSHEWLEPGVDPLFKVVVKVMGYNPLTDHPDRRYASILVKDISQGKVVNGPAFT